MIPASRIRQRPAILPASIEALDAGEINRYRFRWGKRPSSTPRPKDLPEGPLTRGELPPGAPAILGRLAWRNGACRRPFVFLSIQCPRCGQIVLAPWRADWPVGSEVVSYQIIGCKNGERTPYLLALDPRWSAESAETLREAQALFVVWKARRQKLFAERKAARQAKRGAAAASTPAVVLRGFNQPPVGTPSRGAMP